MAAVCWAVQPVQAAPRLPSQDSEVLERLPARADAPRARERARLQQAWRAAPQDVAAAVALAQHDFDTTAADGDPRHIGHAQATLAPWWSLADPPWAVRLVRAQLRQFNHDFAGAVQDLQAVVRAQPQSAVAWAWLAAIALVQGRAQDAGTACQRLASLQPGPLAVACQSQVQALTGQTAAGLAALQQAWQTGGSALAPEQAVWVLTRLGELHAALGDTAAAEQRFQQALALGHEDVYLRAAHADLLLDAGRPAQVLQALEGRGRADLLLLRLALAAQAQHDPRAEGWTRELAARFEAAARRGDSTHDKEASRLALAQGRTAEALALAARNFEVQKEVADARALLEAALAARQPAAAQPVRDWMKGLGLQHARLQALLAQLEALR